MAGNERITQRIKTISEKIYAFNEYEKPGENRFTVDIAQEQLNVHTFGRETTFQRHEVCFAILFNDTVCTCECTVQSSKSELTTSVHNSESNQVK